MTGIAIGPVRLLTSADPADDLDALLPSKNSLRRGSPTSKRAVIAAHDVLRTAGEDRDRIGVYVAQQHGAVGECAEFIASSYRGAPRLVSPAAFTESVENIVATHVSLTLGLTGIIETFTGTRAAAMQAIMAASDDLLCREIDAALVVALGMGDKATKDAYGALYGKRAGTVTYLAGAAAFVMRRATSSPRLVYAGACCFGPGRDDRIAAVRSLWQAYRAQSAGLAPPAASVLSHEHAQAICDIRIAIGADAVCGAGGDSFALDPIVQLFASPERRAVICLSEEGTAGLLAIDDALTRAVTPPPPR